MINECLGPNVRRDKMAGTVIRETSLSCSTVSAFSYNRKAFGYSLNYVQPIRLCAHLTNDGKVNGQ